MKNCLAIVAMLCMCSCANYKDIPYFQNSDEFDGSKGARLYDLKVKPKDELTIFVFCGADPEAVSVFNIRERVQNEQEHGRISVRGHGRYHRYIVDNDGNIDYPLVGLVHVSDLTLDQVSSKIKTQIAPYFQSNADYVVNTYLENFDITVMGEVKTPNTFSLSRPVVNVLEALAMAGDMTIYGKRDNVKILRELSDGTFEVHELDLRDANILNSPYYYLQQRDIVYVEPNEAMVQSSKVGTTTRLWVRGASIPISLGSLLYRVLQ